VITPLRRSVMRRVLKGSHSFTCTPRVHLLTEWTEAGTHLPTPEGWKAELAQLCKLARMWFVTQYYHIIFIFAVLVRWLIYDCGTEFSFVCLTNDSRLLLDLYASINVCMWLAYSYQILSTSNYPGAVVTSYQFYGK